MVSPGGEGFAPLLLFSDATGSYYKEFDTTLFWNTVDTVE